MTEKDDPLDEGHTREWQDRARVVLDAKKDVLHPASPQQSPVENEDVEEKSPKLNADSGKSDY